MRLINSILFLILGFAGPLALGQALCSDVLGPTLPHAYFTAALNNSADLSRLVVEVSRYKVPNDKYALDYANKGFVDIVKVGGLHHTYLAVFNHSVYMNLALGRLATYQTQNRIMTDQALARANSQAQSYAGHDLPKALFDAYLKVHPMVHTPVKSGIEGLRLQVERDFWNEVVLPLREKDPGATLIAVSLNYMPGQTISHETLHAHFYEKPFVRDAVDTFWSLDVAPEDKAQVLSILKREKYDIENHEQVINEFFAYTLEKGRPEIFPLALKAKYQRPLTDALKKAGFDLPNLVPSDMR